MTQGRRLIWFGQLATGLCTEKNLPPSYFWTPSSRRESPAAWAPGTGGSRPSDTATASSRSDWLFAPWHWPGHRSCGRSEWRKQETGLEWWLNLLILSPRNLSGPHETYASSRKICSFNKSHNVLWLFSLPLSCRSLPVLELDVRALLTNMSWWKEMLLCVQRFTRAQSVYINWDQSSTFQGCWITFTISCSAKFNNATSKSGCAPGGSVLTGFVNPYDKHTHKELQDFETLMASIIQKAFNPIEDHSVHH